MGTLVACRWVIRGRFLYDNVVSHFQSYILPFFNGKAKCVVFDTNDPVWSLASFSRGYVTLFTIVFKLT